VVFLFSRGSEIGNTLKDASEKLVQIQPPRLEEFERRNMSTVMHCFKIKKTELWSFCDNLRTFHREEAAIFQFLKIAKTEEVHSFVHDSHYHVNLQLFEENESTWLIRVLENGYLFLNRWQQFNQIKPVFYDDRSDMPEEQEDNLAIAEWIDAFLKVKQYFIVPIIDKDYLYNYWFELQEKKVKERL
jgi:hypothetical protein